MSSQSSVCFALKRNSIGAIYEQRGAHALAARAFTRAVQADPEHARALEGLGLAYLEDRQLEQARAMLTRAVAADPGAWRAHNGLGLAADALGDHPAAESHFSAALALRPGTASILNNRGYSKYFVEELRRRRAATATR